jgi:hypothetical protein
MGDEGRMTPCGRGVRDLGGPSGKYGGVCVAEDCASGGVVSGVGCVGEAIVGGALGCGAGMTVEVEAAEELGLREGLGSALDDMVL